jgi:hypothetical protein
MPPRIDLLRRERTRASAPRQYGSESSVKAPLLVGDHEWVWAATVLAGLSVFAQMDPRLDWVITIAYVASAIWLFSKDDFIVIYAILGVFASRLYLYSGGVSMVNAFILLYVARMLILREAISLNGLTSIALYLVALHGILVVFPAKGYMAFLNYAATCGLVVSLLTRLRDLELLKKFLISFSIGAVAACLYGLVNPRALTPVSNEMEIVDYVRFKGVLSDPNYMGLLLVLGLIGAQLLGRRVLAIRIVFSLILVVFVLQTGSLTGLISLVLVAALFTISARRAVSYGLLALGVLVVAMNLGSIYSWLTTWDAFNFMVDRVARTLQYVGNGDYGSVGSGRVQIAQQYLHYFWNQDVFGVVFGGNLVGAYGVGDALVRAFGDAAMPHNFHIELLMTIGLFGWLAASVAAATGLMATGFAFLKTHSGTLRALAITKIALLLYSFSLSMFPSWWFLALYLVSPHVMSSSARSSERFRNAGSFLEFGSPRRRVFEKPGLHDRVSAESRSSGRPAPPSADRR